MNKEPSSIKKTFGDFSPKLVQLTDDVLFGDVWERPELSKRDRSLVTVTALIAGGNSEQLPFHLKRARLRRTASPRLSSLRPSPIWPFTLAGPRRCLPSQSPRKPSNRSPEPRLRCSGRATFFHKNAIGVARSREKKSDCRRYSSHA
jgi:hypothetical protein